MGISKQFGFLLKYFLMAECKERLFSVITAHTAFTNTSKRKMMGCQMHNGVVDTTSAKR